MIGLAVRRLVPIATVLMLAALLVALNMPPAPRSDMWFHLRLGDEFLAGWPIPSPGHLGAFDTAEWVPTQWLSQMAMSSAENVWGLTGVLVMSASIQALTFATVYITCRAVAAPSPSAVASAACFFGMIAALSPRPQIASYLLFALTVAGWRATHRSGRAPLWVVPLTWLWVPLHGMWPVGIVLGFVMAGALLLDRRIRGRACWIAVGVPLTSLAVSAATPVGPRIYSGIASVGARREYFAEWSAPDFTDFRTLGVLVMAIVVLVVALRTGPVDWFTAASVGVSLALALYSYRTIPLAAIALAPLMAEAIQRGVPDHPRIGRLETALLATGVGLVASGVALLSPARVVDAEPPAWLANRLATMPAGTRLLDDWSTGGYFLWQAPQTELVMHGYADVFTADELDRNADISRVQAGWDNKVDDLDADYALLVPGTALSYALTETAKWTVVERDSEFLLLAPPTP